MVGKGVLLLVILAEISRRTHSLKYDQLYTYNITSCHHHHQHPRSSQASSFCIAKGQSREQLKDHKCNVSLNSLLLSAFPFPTCHLLTITLNEYPASLAAHGPQLKELSHLMDIADGNSTIRTVVMKLTSPHLLKDHNHTFGELMDYLLTPRPWWRVYEEYSTEMILERVSYEYEPHLHFLTSIHFPDAETCSRTPLLVGRYDCIHPGWGAVLGMYEIGISQYPYLILQPYVSRSNNPLENTAFITGADCPNETNKWSCAFLSSTNCTLPSLVTDCHSTNCIPEDNFQFTTLYSHANETGRVVNYGKLSAEERLNYQTSLHSDQQIQLSKHWSRPKNLYILPYDPTVYTSRWPSIGASLSPLIHYLLLRPNAFYRKHMMSYLKRFYDSTGAAAATAATSSSTTTTTTGYSSSVPFKSTDTCTAIHFRRGDRATAMDHNDIREICYNMTHEPKLCLDYNQQLHPCNNVDDYGCSSVPFGILQLHTSLAHIESLIGPTLSSSSSSHHHTHHPAPSRHHVILLSDDYQWLVTEVGKLKYSNPSLFQKYNYLIPPPDMLSQPLHSESRHHDESFKDYFFMRANSGTQSGVYFHSSIKLIQQCNSFIGHMGSSVTRLFFAMMCHKHNGLEGYCPPLYNLEWDREYYVGLMHEHWDRLGLKYEKKRSALRH
jgi:hypothetical protein